MRNELEQSLREALSQRAAQFDPASIARLQAIDYRPRQRRFGTLPAVGAVGATGVAAVVAGIVALGSSAGPAFAGWQSTPTTPTPAQLAQAAQTCGQGLGSPVVTDSRGPYTASIYADSTSNDVCLSGNGVSMLSRSTSSAPPSVPAGHIEFGGAGMRDSSLNQLTLADGRAAADVSAVTIELSDGSSVEATVANGWYLAWWPGTATATNAEITTASGTNTVAFPSTPAPPACPAGARCASGYSSAGGPGTHDAGESTVSAGNVSSSQ